MCYRFRLQVDWPGKKVQELSSTKKKKKRKFSDQKVDLFNIRFSNNVFLPNVYVSRLCDCYSIRLLSDHLICSREYVLESMFDNNV